MTEVVDTPSWEFGAGRRVKERLAQDYEVLRAEANVQAGAAVQQKVA